MHCFQPKRYNPELFSSLGSDLDGKVFLDYTERMKNKILLLVIGIAVVVGGILLVPQFDHNPISALTVHTWCDQSKAQRSGPLVGFTTYIFQSDGTEIWKDHTDYNTTDNGGKWTYDQKLMTFSVVATDGTIPENNHLRQTIVIKNNAPVITAYNGSPVHTPLYACDGVK